MIPKIPYKREKWVQRWLKQHYKVDKRFTQWSALRPSMKREITGRNNNLPIITEWSLKTAQATCGLYTNGELKGTISSGANPVTEWLKNIKEFETNFPSHSIYSKY